LIVPHDVLIGYSRLESEAVKPIQERQNNTGISCFLYTTDMGNYAQWVNVVTAAV